MAVQTEIGRYRLVRHLATGGMGEVYLAEAPGAAGFSKRVVVKTLRQDLATDADLVQRFVAEGQLLEALDHPNIAAILDLGQDGNSYFLAMEFVEGFDLRALQRALPMAPEDQEQGQKLSESAVLAILAAVAQALDHAQTRRGANGKPLGIVHHDVTPSNVMVRRDGHVKLVDFGVARTALVARLSPGALRGKLPYLSPEHARQDRADGRSDLFSLGLCAMEWLSGQRALEVSEPEALAEAYTRLPDKLHALAPHVSPGTWQLLVDLTCLDREERPKNAAELTERANRLLAERGELSPSRCLAVELAPAFDVLEARAGSFDQTLAQTMGLLGTTPGEFTGTLSLPGIEVVQQSSASVRAHMESGGVAPQPLRSRILPLAAGILALLMVVLAAWALTEKPQPAHLEPLHPTLKEPLNRQPQPQVRPQLALPLPLTPTVLAQTPTPQDPPPPEPTPREMRENPRPLPQPQPPQATVEFRVLPADTVILVDGKRRQATSGGDRYLLQLKPGKHVILARDPDGSEPPQRQEVELEAGEHQKLKGFSFLQ